MWNITDKNGRLMLGRSVDTKAEAEKHLQVYKKKYDNKPYPNGKGYYPDFQLKVVKTTQRWTF